MKSENKDGNIPQLPLKVKACTVSQPTHHAALKLKEEEEDKENRKEEEKTAKKEME